jgi:uncharacterized repeat protein (TIGR01451 family)
MRYRERLWNVLSNSSVVNSRIPPNENRGKIYFYLQEEVVKKYWKRTLATLTVLALVFSLILPSSLVAAGSVSVQIVECPGKCGWVVPVSHEFGIKAEITNTSGDVVPDVQATIEVMDFDLVEIVPGNLKEHTFSLGDMGPNTVTTVAWTLHCKGPGDTSVVVFTNRGGSASCTINQAEDPELSVTVSAPCEIGVDCGDTYTVSATICNEGDAELVNGFAVLSFDTNLVEFDPVHAPQNVLVLLPVALAPECDSPDNCYTITWYMRAKAKSAIDGVLFTVDASATNPCNNQVIEATPGTATTTHLDYQVDAQVAAINPDGTYTYPAAAFGDWAFLANCDDWVDQGVTADKDKAVVSRLGQGALRAYVWNKDDEEEWVRIVMKKPAGTELIDTDYAVQIAKGPSPEVFMEFGVDDPQVTVDGDQIIIEPGVKMCACGYMDVRVYLDCTAAAAAEDVIIEVYSSDVSATGPWTFEDSNVTCDPAAYEQEEKVHLNLTPTVQVQDCDASWVDVDAVAVGQTFKVKVVAQNTGDATAENVTFDVVIGGENSCNPNYPSQTTISAGPYNIAGKSFAEKVLTCICEGEDPITVEIMNIEGDDANTCQPILEQNITPVCELEIPQIPVDIVIINPVTCEEIQECETYAVKAMILNWSEEYDLTGMSLNLVANGPAEVISANPMEIDVTSAFCQDPWLPCCDPDGGDQQWPDEGDEMPASVYEVTWMVECTGGDDVEFRVCADVAEPKMRGLDDIFCPQYQLVKPWYDMEDPFVPDDPPIPIPDWDWQTQFPNWTCDNATPEMEWGGPNGNGEMYPRWPVVVHQIPAPPADVIIEIVSPDNLDTMVATSQDFAVTAIVVNNEEFATLTVNNAELCFHPDTARIVESPKTPFVLGPKESKTITWTLHAEESSALFLDAKVRGTTDLCQEAEQMSLPLLVWIYPAAHLEVDIGPMPMQVDVGETFWVPFTVTNTGEADATEVEIALSVTPEGSARPAPGPNGFTYSPTDFGYFSDTIPGHGSENNWIAGNIELVCKAACATTINIDVTGLDEYGWHEKQVSQSSGHFIVEGGTKYFEPLDPAWENDGNGIDPPTPTGWTYGLLVGETGGMLGPFSINTPFSFALLGDNGVVNGTLHAYGAVIPEVGSAHFGDLSYIINAMADTMMPEFMWEWQTACMDLFDMMRGNSVTKDVLVYVGWIEYDSWYDWEAAQMGWGPYCIEGGLFQIINGVITSTELSMYSEPGPMPPAVLNMIGGTYNSTMAKDALRPIDPLFLEDDWWTVKQMLPAELCVTKTVDKEVVEDGDEVVFTVTVTNHGPGDATNVTLIDTVGPYLNVLDVAVSAGTWDAGDWYGINKIPVGGSETLMMLCEVDGLTEAYTWNEVAITWSDQADWNPNNDTNSAYVVLADPPPPEPNYLELELDAGWNLISLPVIPTDGVSTTMADYDINDVLGEVEANVDDVFGVWSYWGEAWTSAVPVGGGAYAGDLTMVEDGKGFWINMAAPDTLNVTGIPLLDAPNLPPTYDLNVGWNLIGFKSAMPRTAGDYLAGIAGKYVIIYRFVDGVYSIVQADENMMPGEGYWIALTDTGTIYP